ncbi:MAG: insulinase family protein, partial [Porphyromonadaceae bacterium]|nr:insulinase family protein [Porphyromonadaceae bacterium]
MLDRYSAPPIKEIEKLTFPEVDTCTLPNGIPFYVIDRGEEELSRVDILFSAGKVQERQPLTAKLTAAMLREGAGGLSSARIAEQLDYYGASLQTLATQRNTYITLYSANRYFFDLLPLLHTLVVNPDFPEKEFETLKNRNAQMLAVELDKVDVLAGRAFMEQLFGAGHPYGRTERLTDYDGVTTEHLREFHRLYYTARRCRIVLSGKISPEMREAVRAAFADLPVGEIVNVPVAHLYSSNEHYRFVEKSGALQSGIRIGNLVVGRDHP